MSPRPFSALLLFAGLTSLSAQTPSFELYRDTTPAYGALGIASGDFNNDGKPDLIYAGGNSETALTLRLNNGDGTFQAPSTVGQADSAMVEEIAVADFNNDGKLDVVTLCVAGTFDVFFGNGDGSFKSPFALALSGNVGALSMAAADFDKDGFADIAVGVSNGTVQIYKNTNGSSFVFKNAVTVDSSSEAALVRAGDFNGDGTSSLAVLTWNAAYQLWNDGSGNFTKKTLSTYINPSGLTVGDLNQDGSADVVVSYSCEAYPSNPGFKGPDTRCMGIQAFYGQGQGKMFSRTLISNTGIAPSPYLAPVDINGDGIADIAMATTKSGAQTGLFIWLGHADGSFDQTPTNFISTTDGVGGLVAADLNRDGMIDFAQTFPGSGQVGTYMNATTRAACAVSQISPTVTVCQPVDNTYIAGNIVRVQANSYDKNQVTAMQLYVNGSLTYSQAVTSFDQQFTLQNDKAYNLVVKAWDYTGLSFRSNRHVYLYAGTPGKVCFAAPGTANLCLDSRNNHAFPIHIVANGATAVVPSAAQLYIDGVLVVENKGCMTGSSYCAGGSSSIDLWKSIASGNHDVVFKLWDANGNVYTDEKTLTVN